MSNSMDYASLHSRAAWEIGLSPMLAKKNFNMGHDSVRDR